MYLIQESTSKEQKYNKQNPSAKPKGRGGVKQ
jgi:hypothetical protein